MPQYTKYEEIPPQFLSTREEMEYEVYKLYCNTDMSFDELVDEIQLIEDMFDAEPVQDY